MIISLWVIVWDPNKTLGVVDLWRWSIREVYCILYITQLAATCPNSFMAYPSQVLTYVYKAQLMVLNYIRSIDLLEVTRDLGANMEPVDNADQSYH